MFKIILNNCCGLDVHKDFFFAYVSITDNHSRTHFYEARFSVFSKGLRELATWLQIVLAHPKYTKSMKGNNTDRKDAKWICVLFMCGLVRPSFIPPEDIRQL